MNTKNSKTNAPPQFALLIMQRLDLRIQTELLFITSGKI